MTKKDKILQILEEMGYCPKVDEDNDIIFRFQLKAVYFSIIDDDEPDQTMVLGSFYDIDEEDAVRTLVVCNKMNRELRHIKVFMNPDMKGVSAMYQFIFTDDDTARTNIELGLKLFSCVRTMFSKDVDELTEATNSDDDAA